jgi:hypothetical protein
MPVTSEVREAGPYTGTGTVDTYSFAFKVFDGGDLRVTTDGVALEIGTDYTVDLNTDQDAAPGGDVVLSEDLADGVVLLIKSNVRPVQSVRLSAAGGFYPSVITNALDRLMICIQQAFSAIVAQTAAVVAAQASADSAQDAADEAQSTADGAASSADAAQSTANTSLSNAATAQSTANGAASAASAAQGTANTAVSNAATAQAAAEAAQGTANAALSGAATAQEAADTCAGNLADAISAARAGFEQVWSGIATSVSAEDFTCGNVAGLYLVESDPETLGISGVIAYNPASSSYVQSVVRTSWLTAPSRLAVVSVETFEDTLTMRTVYTNTTTGAVSIESSGIVAIYRLTIDLTT